MKHKKLGLSTLFTVLFSFLATNQAFATLDQAKLYQKVFGGDKPKCTACHTDKLPKKDEGKHELNDYGKKLKAVKEIPDESVYTQVGKNVNTE